MTKKKVILRAPALTSSGYGVHSRQIARFLLERDDIDLSVHLLRWGITPWILDDTRYDGLIGDIMSRTSPDSATDYDISFQVQLPNEWDPNLAKFNIGVTAAVESDRCHPQWVECVNRMNLVIVPSQHAKKVLEVSGNVSTPIVVVPESFPDSILSEEVTPPDLNLDTSFNFLVFGQLTGNNPYNDRKNTFLTLKWMCEVFADDPDVGILIKTNSGRGTKIDRRNTEAILRRVTSEVRPGPNPRIHFLHGDMTETEIAGLYRHPDVKALVSLTRGEGYGLPILEASASGLPVIATAWSGHMDFLSKGKFNQIEYDLQPIHESRVDGGIWIEGAQWAEPKEEDVKRKLKRFRSKTDKPDEWAQDMRIALLGQYNFSDVSRAYAEVLETI